MPYTTSVVNRGSNRRVENPKSIGSPHYGQREAKVKATGKPWIKEKRGEVI